MTTRGPETPSRMLLTTRWVAIVAAGMTLASAVGLGLLLLLSDPDHLQRDTTSYLRLALTCLCLFSVVAGAVHLAARMMRVDVAPVAMGPRRAACALVIGCFLLVTSAFGLYLMLTAPTKSEPTIALKDGLVLTPELARALETQGLTWNRPETLDAHDWQNAMATVFMNAGLAMAMMFQMFVTVGGRKQPVVAAPMARTATV